MQPLVNATNLKCSKELRNGIMQERKIMKRMIMEGIRGFSLIVHDACLMHNRILKVLKPY